MPFLGSWVIIEDETGEFVLTLSNQPNIFSRAIYGMDSDKNGTLLYITG